MGAARGRDRARTCVLVRREGGWRDVVAAGYRYR